ncbi:MAG: hypothetical protein ACI835_002891 [Planctomycetota bacterium]|jgi:hypothetical protein
MSAVLRSYLWKEWREQRKLIGGLVLGLLMIVGVNGALDLWTRGIDSMFTYTWVTAMCVIATSMTVGSDLFARERHGSQLSFLERLPAGLSMAFRGKLLFFLLLMIAATLFGLGLAALGGLVFGSGVPRFTISSWSPFDLAMVLTVVLWTFAVSTWIRTSVTAVPITLLMLGVLSTPVVVFHRLMLLTVSWPMPHQWWFLGSLALGALVAARVCFVNASARARPKRVAVGYCLGVGLLAFLPVNTWAALQWGEWQRRPYFILDAVIGDNGRFAYLSLAQVDLGRSYTYESMFSQDRGALIVDLDSGAWRFVSDHVSSWFLQRNGALLLSAWPTESELSTGNVEGVTQEYDPSTGQPVDTTLGAESMPTDPADYGLESFARQDWSHVPTVRASGLGHLAIFPRSNVPGPTNLFRSSDGTQVLDVSSERVRDVIIMRDGFLLLEEGIWQWFDPDTREHTRSALLGEGDHVLALLDDGSLMVLREQGLHHVDLDSGVNDSIEMEGFTHRPLGLDKAFTDYQSRSKSLWAPLNPSKPFLIVMASDPLNTEPQLVMLDLDDGVLRAIKSVGLYHNRLVWSAPDRVIVATDHHQLMECDLETGQRTILFDVADLNR